MRGETSDEVSGIIVEIPNHLHHAIVSGGAVEDHVHVQMNDAAGADAVYRTWVDQSARAGHPRDFHFKCDQAGVRTRRSQ